MSWTLAITGKGGVGKTTLAALAVRRLGECSKGPVLAVDADPNTCLDTMLGVEARATVGRVREKVKSIVQDGTTEGISKGELLDLKIQESLVESETFDLIAMGRPEGPGCYCYANNVLRDVLARLANQYPSIVIDNEAGLENLSRRTVQKVDQMIFVTDPSPRGLVTARRLYDLSGEMEIDAHAMGVVVNRARDSACLEGVRRIFADTTVAVLGTLPDDTDLARGGAAGESIFSLPQDNEVYQAASKILDAVMQLN